MIPKSILSKDLDSILSSVGCDEFYKDDFIFKGKFRQNAEVMFDDRAVGYSNTFIMSAKDFNKANLKLKDTITHKETIKTYRIMQILSEFNNTLKRLILEETGIATPLTLSNSRVAL